MGLIAVCKLNSVLNSSVRPVTDTVPTRSGNQMEFNHSRNPHDVSALLLVRRSEICSPPYEISCCTVFIIIFLIFNLKFL